MLSNPWIAMILTFAIALIWLRINDFAAHRGWVSSELSRKIIHIGTGPIFILCWLLFPDVPLARYLAAIVPLLITSQFVLVGIGIIKDEAAVKAMSRTGDRREILRGPLYYGLIFVLLTILYWKETPIGIVALLIMCGGDGLAEIIGRRWGFSKLPWNKNKSWLGSLGMLLGGWLFCVLVLWVFVTFGVFKGAMISYLPAVTITAIASTLIETLPFKDIDNITITLTALIIGILVFPAN